MLLQRPLPRRAAPGWAVCALRHAAAGDTEYMRRQAAERFDQIAAALRQLPNSVLLVIRNMNLIRAITTEHGSRVDRYRLMARSATQGAFRVEGAGLRAHMSGYWQRLVFDWRLFVDSVKIWAMRQTIRLLALVGKAPPELSQLAAQL